MELKEFIKLVDLNRNNIEIEKDAGTSLDYEFDVNPEDFLKFANRDIEGGDTRALVNALSNSKRAIDCQVDKVFRCFGIDVKKWNFPHKAKLLDELGVVAPRIVSKVIHKRNYLEHEYKYPEKEEVEDAIDIAALFIEASNNTLNNFWDAFQLGDKGNICYKNGHFKHCISFHLKPDREKIELYGNKDGKYVGNITVTSKDEIYLAILKLAISVGQERNIDDAIQNFVRLVNI